MDNPLPADIKQNVANLGVFIFNHTMKTLIRPEPGKLTTLININRQIAAGLRASAAAGQAPAAG
ncbi:flagellar biosynthesis regulator FlaF [Methylobrevis pamukkalensis]|uniref:Flagellar biosynthesis regulatory protein FlaF n=1 Tax=Methylobrevis pamukkalensis TaxID=1439726 RepID=A0A1E3H388_9HYPH|nr:flagellar biosynthesis regulator FlaF [Methylobrevis pamukkalensis]ODN70770.1 flagellar biosynthesis regulatory protein FlaF [Methylobrevis pamukkalensis]